MIREVGCPEHLHSDAVHHAFVMALSKPISERRPVTNWKQFVSWMCTLAKFAALTERNMELRRRESDELPSEAMAKRFAAPEQIKDIFALEALEEACMQLAPEDRALLAAHYDDEKSITEIACEQNLARSTVESRLQRVLKLLRNALHLTIFAFVSLVTKNARAQGERLARQVLRRLPHATQTAGAMSVTVACGMFVPTNTTAMTGYQPAPTSVALAKTETAITVAPAPSLPEEVAFVKQMALDEPDGPWSASTMKSTKLAICLQSTVVPFGFLMASAMTQVACAGAERQAPPPQQPEEEDDGGPDQYEMHCNFATRLGGKCESKGDWCAENPGANSCK